MSGLLGAPLVSYSNAPVPSGTGNGTQTLQLYKQYAAETLADYRLIANLSTLTSFSAFNSTPVNYPQFYDWLRIRDDGTNRYLDVSQDGTTWYNVFSIARTTWLTPTQVGFCFCSQGQALVASLFSWAGA